MPAFCSMLILFPFYTSTGVAAILSQFNISHFRSIAWYNVALGVSFIVLEFLMFHGESKCPDLHQGCNCRKNWKRGKIDVTLILVSSSHFSKFYDKLWLCPSLELNPSTMFNRCSYTYQLLITAFSEQ